MFYWFTSYVIFKKNCNNKELRQGNKGRVGIPQHLQVSFEPSWPISVKGNMLKSCQRRK